MRDGETYCGSNCMKIIDGVEHKCQYYNKDFCPGVKGSFSAQKSLYRDNRVKRNNSFFDKNKFEFIETKTENVIIVDYKYSRYYVSLNRFKWRKEGTKDWIEKKKSNILKLGSILTFGKHKDKKVIEVLEEDFGYIRWVLEKTEKLIDIKVAEKINEKIIEKNK